MKRFAIFISLHLFLFLLVIAYQAQADEDKWSLDDFGSYVVASVHGEVVWGDKLRFALMKKNLKFGSYKLWRKRVENCKTKHDLKRVAGMKRFKSKAQKLITNNTISKRK